MGWSTPVRTAIQQDDGVAIFANEGRGERHLPNCEDTGVDEGSSKHAGRRNS